MTHSFHANISLCPFLPSTFSSIISSYVSLCPFHGFFQCFLFCLSQFRPLPLFCLPPPFTAPWLPHPSPHLLPLAGGRAQAVLTTRQGGKVAVLASH